MRDIQNFTDYARTGNPAIDLVAQAVGWAKRYHKPIKSVTLNRLNYAKFWAGVEILMQAPLPEQHCLEFEGVPVLQGPRGMFESITMQLHTDVQNPGALNVKPIILS